MKLHKFGGNQYAPVPVDKFLDQIQHDHDYLVSSLKEDLSSIDTTSDTEYVWNIDGHDNIMAKAVEMIRSAKSRIYLAVLPPTFPELKQALSEAITLGVRVVIYSSFEFDLEGSRMVVAPMQEEELKKAEGLGLVLVTDGEEVLIAEKLPGTQARSSWTRSPLFVLIAEHHLRTDLYLPQILSLLGDKAKEIIHEDDQELFACALESRIKH
jgi:sugar-specific transcriptional regulator TrmB